MRDIVAFFLVVDVWILGDGDSGKCVSVCVFVCDLFERNMESRRIILCCQRLGEGREERLRA